MGQKTLISTGLLNLGQNVKCIGFVDEIFGFSNSLSSKQKENNEYPHTCKYSLHMFALAMSPETL